MKIVGPLAAAEEEDVEVSIEEGTGKNTRSGGPKDPMACNRYVNVAMEQISGINIYDIFADVCIAPASTVAEARQLAALLADADDINDSSSPNQPLPLLGLAAAAAHHRHVDASFPTTSSSPSLAFSDEYDPCVDNEVELYFNRPEVQAALHANVSGTVPGPWTDCSPRVRYSRSDLLSSMLPVYRGLLNRGLKILVYSGDVDAIVPVIGTRRWVAGLGLEEAVAWRPWSSETGQVGGWTVEYEGGVRFATVRGAGHMVPYTQPERALAMFSRFVGGMPL
jgi:pimeloyl-ACP methyl ester carboxylesterase